MVRIDRGFAGRAGGDGDGRVEEADAELGGDVPFREEGADVGFEEIGTVALVERGVGVGGGREYGVVGGGQGRVWRVEVWY